MLGRLLSFALFQVAGAVFGWWFSRSFMSLSTPSLAPMLLCALVASYFWLVLDVARGMRVTMPIWQRLYAFVARHRLKIAGACDDGNCRLP